MTMLANRIERLHPSPIREILHVIEEPGMISFAGGLPSADSFPDLTRPTDPLHLQYGPSEGEPSLRQQIAQDLTARGLPTRAEHVLILSGSQQGIDLVAKLLVEEGTPVAVESPTYLAALQVFSLFGADYIPYTSTNPEKILTGKIPALTYVIPTFQNPTGHAYSLDERRALAAACDKANTTIFEDDPYRELCYDDCDRTPVCSLLTQSPWIYQSSFSKTLAPGLRLGFLTCSPALFPLLVRLKQASDLHSNRIAQHMVLSQLTRSDRDQRMISVVDSYRTKRDVFENTLQMYFSDIAEWETPKGGLFYWLELKNNNAIDTRKLLPEAIQKKVAFMPGEPFYPDGRSSANQIRLNFSHADKAQIHKGLRILAELIRSRQIQ